MLWIGLGAAGLVLLIWLASRLHSQHPPLGGKGEPGAGEGSGVPRDPRPLVRTGAAEEPLPEDYEDDPYHSL
jgi:hypothetical protein